MALALVSGLALLAGIANASPHGQLLHRAPVPPRSCTSGTTAFARSYSCIVGNGGSTAMITASAVCASYLPPTSTITVTGGATGVLATATVNSTTSVSTIFATPPATTVINDVTSAATTVFTTDYSTVTSGTTTITVNTTTSTITEFSTSYTCASASSTSSLSAVPFAGTATTSGAVPASGTSSSTNSSSSPILPTSSTADRALVAVAKRQTTTRVVPPACLTRTAGAAAATITRICTDCLGLGRDRVATISVPTLTYTEGTTTTTIGVVGTITSTPTITQTHFTATSYTTTITTSTPTATTVPATVNLTSTVFTTVTSTVTSPSPNPTNVVLYYFGSNDETLYVANAVEFANGPSTAVCFSEANVLPLIDTFTIDPQGRLSEFNRTNNFAAQTLPAASPLLYLRNDTAAPNTVPNCTACNGGLSCEYSNTTGSVFAVCPQAGLEGPGCLALGQPADLKTPTCMQQNIGFVQFAGSDAPSGNVGAERIAMATHRR